MSRDYARFLSPAGDDAALSSVGLFLNPQKSVKSFFLPTDALIYYDQIIMKKKYPAKKRASHSAAVPKKEQPAPKKEQPIAKKEEPVQHSATQDEDQMKRLKNLVGDVRQAFTRNGFAIPGDLELRVRDMAPLHPHHAPRPEMQVGPNAA